MDQSSEKFQIGKNLLKWFLISLGVASAIFLSIFAAFKLVPEKEVGISVPGAQWVVIGDNEPFTGYQTKDDPSKVDNGANPQGQNTTINNGDRISIRDVGTELFPAGTASTTVTKVNSLHTFRKRSGENLMLRTFSTFVEWYDENQDSWEVLKDGYTSDQVFGFADYNINTDLTSKLYFGNGVESFSIWSGAHTNINGALSGGEGTITVDDTTDGFTDTGTLIFCGTEVTYTGRTPTTFTGASGTPACDDNEGLAQAVDDTLTANPRGNIYMVASNRLFISGVSSTAQAVFFSKYGDADEFTTTTLVTDGTAEDSGIFNLAEGGGAVTAMAQDENAIYFFKRTIIYRATLTDGLYTLTALKSFDGGKSQTTGAINQKSTFSGGNGIFFITPDNQIMNLTRVEAVDFPQIIPISDPIKPTISAARFASSTGIFFKDKAYFAAKTDINSTINDVVFVYNFRRQAWDSPIVGWNAEDWVIYDDTAGDDLYFGDSTTANTYIITTVPLDDIHGVSANWRSKQFDFGLPQSLKEIENVFIEGYIANNTSLTISLLLDDNGFTQILTTDLAGTETDYLFDSPSYNVFGFNVFGTERFGSNEDESGKKKFRVYLKKNLRRTPFYNAQLEFASDGENTQWEVLRFGFLTREHSQPEKRGLFREF